MYRLGAKNSLKTYEEKSRCLGSNDGAIDGIHSTRWILCKPGEPRAQWIIQFFISALDPADCLVLDQVDEASCVR
jgi:hypothetical protein